MWTDKEYLDIGKYLICSLMQCNPLMIYKHLVYLTVKPEYDETKKYRYKLEITKNNNMGEHEKVVSVIMLNPSIANEYIADKSVFIIEQLIFENPNCSIKNIGKLIIINKYGLIKKDNFKARADIKRESNLNAVKTAFEESNYIVLAWGKDKRGDKEIFQLMKQMKNKRWFMIKEHPSRPTKEIDITEIVLNKDSLEQKYYRR